jgi:hypothetical protein
MDEPTSEMPDPEGIRTQVDRIIASSELSRSPQLGAFLRFVVESVLRGDADRIKAYTIGIEVLRRDSKFDPQIDPIVRVEATRLRRAIDRYYAGPGIGDAIRIEIPRGSYVPTFRRGGPELGAPAPHSVRISAIRPLHAIFVAIVAVGLIGVTVAVLRGPSRIPEPAAIPGAPSGAPSRPGASALSPGNGLPVLFIPPFEVSGTPGAHSIQARTLHDALSYAFTQFDLVNILLAPKDAQPGDNSAAAREQRADYRFAGSVEYSSDGATRLLFRLIDTADGSIVWSRAFDPIAAADDPSSAEEKVVRQLAGTLLQPFGVIYARQRLKALDGTLHDPRYRCLVVVIQSFSSFDPAEHARGRDCLDVLTSRDPSFALGFTYLAALDLREYQYGIDRRPGDAPALERGLTAARRGVELNPESSRAYEMLFVILFARHDLVAAFDAANKAITLNKYDTRLLASYGARLIANGEIDKGMNMLRQAGDAGTVRPPFEEFFLFLGEYLRNNFSAAASHADQITGDTFQLGLVARALVAAGKGDRDNASRALARLVTLNPAWRDDLRGTLGRFFSASWVINQIANDLTAAGLAARP